MGHKSSDRDKATLIHRLPRPTISLYNYAHIEMRTPATCHWRSMTVINVEHLSKSFDYYRKALGLSNSLKNLFHREKLIKEAVRNISFQVQEGEMVGFLRSQWGRPEKPPPTRCFPGILHPTSGRAHGAGLHAVGSVRRRSRCSSPS